MNSFNVWLGIVEDRNDPEFLGRYRVRIFGLHTANKQILPTADLPWAIPVMPSISASISGVGFSPTGIVEGSTVIGLFLDDEEQQPAVLGTIPGIPFKDANHKDPDNEAGADEENRKIIETLEKQISELDSKIQKDPTNLNLVAERNNLQQQRDLMAGVGNDVGFCDPFKQFPRCVTDTGLNSLKEPDSSRLARNGDAEKHITLTSKRSQRLSEENGGTQIPTAVAPDVSSVGEKYDNAKYDRETWEEPHPRFGNTATGAYPELGVAPTEDNMKPGESSLYPYNHVRETESGHVFEVDDTPDNGRIHEFHNSGTFYEIQAGGDKITKIVGDDYEIVLQNKKCFIQGALNITVGGDANFYIKGDKYEEIEGNSFTTILGDRVTKIGGNDLLEVLTDSNTQINGRMGQRVTGDNNLEVLGNQDITVALDRKLKVSGKDSEIFGADRKVQNNASYTEITKGNYSSIAIGNIKFGGSGNVEIGVKGTSKLFSTGSQTLKSDAAQELNATVTNILQDTNVTGTVDASVEVKAGSPEVTLTGHKHEYVPGSGSPTDTATGEG